MSDSNTPGFYDGSDYHVEDSVGYLMRQIVNIISAVIDDRMAVHGLTDAQWKPLLAIRQGIGCTAAELARFACCDTGAMTRLLDRVESKGLVTRSRSQEDRRVVNLELTEQGERAAEVVPYLLAEVVNTILAGFSDAEVLQLKSMLQRILANSLQLRDSDAVARI